MKNFDLLPKLLLRTPVLPLSRLWNQLSDMQNPKEAAAMLKAIFQDQQVREALFLGSPNLHQRCLEWLNGEITDKQEAHKIVQSLLRYYFRMSTRCTPFGLFAGCSMGRWGKETDIELSPLKKKRRHTRLDMHYLCALAQRLEADETLRPFLTYFPNSSIYRFGDKIRFVEYYYKNNNRLHQISAVSCSAYLLQLLETSQAGASFDELAHTLLDDDVSLEEARVFIHEVIDSQLLVSELEPAITGEDLLTQLLDVLNRVYSRQADPPDHLRQTIAALTRVRAWLDKLDQSEEEDNYPVYQRIAAELKQLGVPYDISKLFQLDMGRKAERLQFCNRLAGSIRKGLTVLNKLHARSSETARRAQVRSNLQQFQEAFYKRYETREVPLLQALDNESGIGYLQSAGPGDTHPMIDDIRIQEQAGTPSFQLNEQDAFLLKKLLAAYRQNAYEIELKDEELKDFPEVWADLPDTLSVMGAAISAPDAGQGMEKVLIKSAGGSSAANLLGRFTHLDPQIDRFSREITRHEQELHPEVIFAEIVHLPEARTGNILMRTQLRAHEIPFLARSSVARERQIALQDLRLSVKDNRLVLRSEKRNKIIIPRLSTAHNFSLSALPVYQFLCDLQYQPLPGDLFPQTTPYLSFSWGPLEQQFYFLPRVTYQNLILHRAAWNLEKEHYQELLRILPEKYPEAISNWRRLLRMPRRIAVADSDNELFIDLENPVCLKLFIGILKKRPAIRLKEFLFNPEAAVVRDGAGDKYTNEFIMAFARKKKTATENRRKAIENEEREKVAEPVPERSFSAGGEWLYYKFYAGAQATDELLSEYILPLTEELTAEGLIDHWFFIRYGDSDLHLRLRFYLADTSRIGEAIQYVKAYMSTALDHRKVWKIQIDTYEREVERYGPLTIALSEQIFHHDSLAIVHFLQQARAYEDPELLRWFFAMINIDQLLDNFQLDLEAKTTLLETMKTGFAREFNANNKFGARQLSKKYRSYREAIEDLVQGKIDAFPEELTELLKNKSNAIRPLCERILQIHRTGRLQVGLNSFLASHIHMLMNRLFRSQQRKYEWVVYDMLYRGYQSVLARTKKG